MGRVHAVVPWIALVACGRVGFDPLGVGGSGAGDGGGGGDAGPADCPFVGNLCADGTSFGGLSPDGNKPMFVEPTVRYGGPWSYGSGSAPVLASATGLWDVVTGAANTAALATGGAHEDSDLGVAGVQPHEAANYCANLTALTFTDWYLPAYSELQVIYANKAAIGGFPDDEYWSSTENSDDPMNCALAIDFVTGMTSYYRSKYDYRAVRCVRK